MQQTIQGGLVAVSRQYKHTGLTVEESDLFIKALLLAHGDNMQGYSYGHDAATLEFTLLIHNVIAAHCELIEDLISEHIYAATGALVCEEVLDI